MSNETLIRRLVLIKKLQLEAERYIAENTEPSRVIGVILLDCSVEHLLGTINSIPSKEIKETTNFHQLWETTNERIKELKKEYSLPYITQMKHLHKVRNNAQHYGIVPDLSELKEGSHFAREFFRDVSKQLFNIEIENLHLSSLIKNQKVRSRLIEAEKTFENQDLATSMKYSVLAFELAMLDEQTRISGSGWSFVRHFGSISYRLQNIPDKDTRENLKEIRDKFNRLLEKLDDELEVLKLGLDYKKYRYFRKISPRPIYGIETDINNLGLANVTDTEQKNYTKNNALFCIDFVLVTVLNWETFYSPSWMFD